VPHYYPTGVAGQALRRSRGNAPGVLKAGLARGIAVRQHLGIDVDDDLVALARGAGVEHVMQGDLGEQRERVGLLLLHRGRVGLGCLVTPPLVQHLACRREGLHEQHAGLG
jgi:hypothetical protein